MDKIYSKISSSLFTIKRLSNITEQDVLITVYSYCGLVYPHLMYGITVWGPCPKKYTKKFLYYKRGRLGVLQDIIYIYIYIYIYMKQFYL
jgi:hypothetical protein